jgi:hypothetical protein
VKFPARRLAQSAAAPAIAVRPGRGQDVSRTPGLLLEERAGRFGTMPRCRSGVSSQLESARSRIKVSPKKEAKAA